MPSSASSVTSSDNRRAPRWLKRGFAQRSSSVVRVAPMQSNPRVARRAPSLCERPCRRLVRHRYRLRRFPLHARPRRLPLRFLLHVRLRQLLRLLLSFPRLSLLRSRLSWLLRPRRLLRSNRSRKLRRRLPRWCLSNRYTSKCAKRLHRRKLRRLSRPSLSRRRPSNLRSLLRPRLLLRRRRASPRRSSRRPNRKKLRRRRLLRPQLRRPRPLRLRLPRSLRQSHLRRRFPLRLRQRLRRQPRRSHRRLRPLLSRLLRSKRPRSSRPSLRLRPRCPCRHRGWPSRLRRRRSPWNSAGRMRSRAATIKSARMCTRDRRAMMRPREALLELRGRASSKAGAPLRRRRANPVVRQARLRRVSRWAARRLDLRSKRLRHRHRPRPRANRRIRRRRFHRDPRRRRRPASMCGKDAQAYPCPLHNSGRAHLAERRTTRAHKLRRRVREPAGSDKPHAPPKAVRSEVRVDSSEVVHRGPVDSASALVRHR